MSWLAERQILYRYVLPDGTVHHMKLSAAEEPPQVIEIDGVEAQYAGFEPDELKQTSVVAYDQNGRLAYRIKDKDGKIRHVSKTKHHYMKTGRIENQYTSSYREHLEKTEQEQMLRTEHNRRRAKVKPHRGKV